MFSLAILSLSPKETIRSRRDAREGRLWSEQTPCIWGLKWLSASLCAIKVRSRISLGAGPWIEDWTVADRKPVRHTLMQRLHWRMLSHRFMRACDSSSPSLSLSIVVAKANESFDIFSPLFSLITFCPSARPAVQDNLLLSCRSLDSSLHSTTLEAKDLLPQSIRVHSCKSRS